MRYRLHAPRDRRLRDDVVIIYTENQGCAFWGIRIADLALTDPPVTIYVVGEGLGYRSGSAVTLCGDGRVPWQMTPGSFFLEPFVRSVCVRTEEDHRTRPHSQTEAVLSGTPWAGNSYLLH
jgi:hypothetical protein